MFSSPQTIFFSTATFQSALRLLQTHFQSLSTHCRNARFNSILGSLAVKHWKMADPSNDLELNLRPARHLLRGGPGTRIVRRRRLREVGRVRQSVNVLVREIHLHKQACTGEQVRYYENVWYHARQYSVKFFRKHGWPQQARLLKYFLVMAYFSSRSFINSFF